LVELGSLRLLNPGSVGLPRNGDPRASYAMIVDGVLELRTVTYDAGRAIRRLRDVGAPDDVASAIESIYLKGELASPRPAVTSADSLRRLSLDPELRQLRVEELPVDL
jgi:diadenosine tetraphosphatase ApaH/serine/threonine PP2A family protein phosphatase